MAPTLRSAVAVVLAAASVPAIVVAGLGNSQCSGVAELTEHQIIEFRRSFALLDKDGKGFVTAAQLGGAPRPLGQQRPTEAELQAMIDQTDFDGDGRMDVSEYLCLRGPGRLQEAEEEHSTGVLQILDDFNGSRGASSTGAAESGHANTSGREDLKDEKGGEAVRLTDDATYSQERAGVEDTATKVAPTDADAPPAQPRQHRGTPGPWASGFVFPQVSDHDFVKKLFARRGAALTDFAQA